MKNSACKIGIVILNYQSYRDTLKCIESIYQFKLKAERIVIVDNGSTNNSVEVIRNAILKYEDLKINLISTGDNLGFAKGNNYGIRFLRKKGMNYVLLLNSDTEIISSKYIDDMLEKSKGDVAVVGSNILMSDGSMMGGELEDLSLHCAMFQFFTLFCRLHYISFPPYRYESKCNKELRIHGCSILLTPTFFDHYECLFPYTFLYREEMILSIMCRKANVKVEVAEAYIRHNQGGSSGEIGSCSRMKRKYDFHSLIWQIIVLLMPYKAIVYIMRAHK